ncbi:unnamed protein product [Trichogramma brassicae]|uniref:Uncharacterized protein n=1 Tax=Trichogramma brassicae TaxID=86971 RepID=A0A6H5IJL2_9HYME|nr:unnamed protein product [Trichogramma brassicae]
MLQTQIIHIRDNYPGKSQELPANAAEPTVPANEAELIAPPDGIRGRGGARGGARGRARGAGGEGARVGARGGARGRARGGGGEGARARARGRDGGGARGTAIGGARGGVRDTGAARGRGRGRDRDPTQSPEASPIRRGPGRPRRLQAVNSVDAPVHPLLSRNADLLIVQVPPNHDNDSGTVSGVLHGLQIQPVLQLRANITETVSVALDPQRRKRRKPRRKLVNSGPNSTPNSSQHPTNHSDISPPPGTSQTLSPDPGSAKSDQQQAIGSCFWIDCVGSKEIKTGQSASYFYEQSADQCSRGTEALEFRLPPRRKLIKQRPRKADEEHVQQSDPRNRSEGIKTSRLRYAAKSVLSRPSTGEQVTAPLQSIQIFNLNSAPLQIFNLHTNPSSTSTTKSLKHCHLGNKVYILYIPCTY